MKTSSRFYTVTCVVLALLTLVVALPAYAADRVEPIPPGPQTSLPDYAGAPAKAHPTANTGVPQNPLLAPYPFDAGHLDPWNSDVADIAGLLGREPETLSATWAEARAQPESGLFDCLPVMFDSHGRVITVCFNPGEATVVLADPDTLAILDHEHTPIPPGDPIIGTGKQKLLASMGGTYSFLDAQDRFTVVAGGNQLYTFVEAGTAEHPVLELDRTYDLGQLAPVGEDKLAGAMLDWQGRIWLSTLGSDIRPARLWLLNPATATAPYTGVKYVELGQGEMIRNTLAVTKAGVDRAAAYVVTSAQMYRVDAGPDDQPYVVWSEPYDSTGVVRDGQYELGSGTSPTILGEGKYVAITDNAEQLQVVVYRTDAKLDPGEERVVCEVPLFEGYGGAGALSNSLVGSRLSLIASNNTNYAFYWDTHDMTPSLPGFERIDIDPNGKGCTKVWSNQGVATTTSPKLSTRTGLIYTIAREYDSEKDVYAYYWIALDFRTGETVWKKLAGTGTDFDSFYPGLAIGPSGALYYGGYGGFMTVRDRY